MALLDLSTEGGEETVVIDKTEYALTSFDDFSPLDQHWFQQESKRMQTLATKDDMSEDDATALNETIDKLFARIAGEIPQDVQDKLKFGARSRIINAYFLAFAAGKVEGKALLEPRTDQPSMNGQKDSSLDSKDFTEGAIPHAG